LPEINRPQFVPRTCEADACAPLVVTGIEVATLCCHLAKRVAARMPNSIVA